MSDSTREDNFDNRDASPLEYFKNFFKGEKKPGEKYPSRPCEEDLYDVSKSQMGLALIFNHINFEENLLNYDLDNRDGADKDVSDLTKVLNNFGFKVQSYVDRTTREMKQIIEDVSCENHDEFNCLLIAVMTHGNTHGVLYTKDKCIRVEEVWAPFNGGKCKSLIGKPKIFLIQACRGLMQDLGAVHESADREVALFSRNNKVPDMNKFVIPTMADFLIFFSSAEGYCSFREADDGSWFVQALCAAFQSIYESKVDTDLMKLFTQINRAIAYAKQVDNQNQYNACKQMPVIVSMLTKTFILGVKGE